MTASCVKRFWLQIRVHSTRERLKVENSREFSRSIKDDRRNELKIYFIEIQERVVCSLAKNGGGSCDDREILIFRICPFCSRDRPK